MRHHHSERVGVSVGPFPLEACWSLLLDWKSAAAYGRGKEEGGVPKCGRAVLTHRDDALFHTRTKVVLLDLPAIQMTNRSACWCLISQCQ